MRSTPELADRRERPILKGFPAPGPLSSDCFNRFVALAARTIGADGSFLLLNSNGELTLAHPFGNACKSPALSWDFVARCDPAPANQEHQENQQDPDTSGTLSLAPVLLHPTPDRTLLATLALRREGALLGILVVCDSNPGSLSCAQELALQAIAVQIADKLQAELPSKPGLGDTLLDPLARLRLLESVVVNANDSVIITQAEPIDSPGPIIQYVNPAFTRTTGFTPQEAIGNSPRMLQGPLSGRIGPDRIRAALKAWKPVEVELLNYRKDGTMFWVELSISPVCDEKGWYTHWISVQRDITERKAHEENTLRIRSATQQNEALIREIHERKLIEAKLTYMAFHDGLTGVRNRSFFMQALQTALIRAKSSRGYRAAIIYLDLDGFKAVNDACGHRVGDLLLIEIAHRLQQCARPQDTVARLGGDEFTWLIDDLETVDQALEAGARLRDAINAPVMLTGMELRVTASVGICEVGPAYPEAENILRDADTAMYRAKRAGNLGCVLFNESMQQKTIADLLMKSQLKAALERREFELFYQPLIRIEDASIVGVEALIRWNHPTRGLLLPGEFIPQAEVMGFIVDMGSWVLQQACADFRILQQASPNPLGLNVNVSSLQLQEANFLLGLTAILDRESIPARMLTFEITESVFLKDPAATGLLFSQLRQLGLRIAFDDFGTGYSSLSYVEKYPVDTLKIDRSFVQHMGRSPMNANIVQMIIRLAQTAGMNVVAEGVETSDQANMLLEYGCPLAQGYLYSRAVSLERTVAMLRKQVQDAA